MGYRGHQLVAERFGWSKIGTQMHEVCQWLLGEANRPDCLLTEKTNSPIHEPSLV
jgi:hypothetical protein